MTNFEFWFKMDMETTNNAIQVSRFPKEITEWIFEIKKKPFQVEMVR